MKKTAAAVLAVILSFSMCISVGAEYTATDNTYVPRDINYSTREEAVSEFIKAVGIDTLKADKKVLKRFSDGGKIAGVYTGAIAAAVEQGMVSGYEDNSFRPQAAISRSEALVILNRILSARTLLSKQQIDFSDTPEWAKADINRLSSAGIVKGYGDGTFGAADLLTSEQTAILAERAARLTGPAGDYYEYINDGWLNKTKLPKGYAAWSDMTKVQNIHMKEIGEIVYSLNRRKYREQEDFAEGSSEQKIADVFAAAGNTAYRDSIGLEPVLKYLNMIEDADNMYSLLKVMAELEKNGFHGLLPFGITPDANNSSEYTPVFYYCYTGMNSSVNAAEYKKYAQNLFRLYGEEQTAADAKAAAVSQMCLDLAKTSDAVKKASDAAENSRKFSSDERRRIFTKLDSDKYLKMLGFPSDSSILIYDLALAEKVNKLWEANNLESIKDYLSLSVMDGSAMYLNSDAFIIWRDYTDSVNGTKSGALPADYAVSAVEELLGWDLAKIYTERYTSQEDKIEVEKMTNKIVFAYKQLLEETPWMTAETKKTAAKKIEKMQIRVGYPDNIEDYPDSGYKVRSIAEGGNLVEYRSDYSKRYFEKAAELLSSGAAEEKTAWTMLPQTVNAMYEPASNSITIPAGILHAPMYDRGASFETNLGGIGTVIAHEVSHALDSMGAKFDEDGNMRNWWNDRDKNAFDGICREVINAYDKIEVLPGRYIDGSKTLGENLADIAGMECILKLAGENNPRLGDIFKNYATIWRMKSDDSYIQMQLENDTHSPDKIRVNRVLSNFGEFERYYKIEKDDIMYLPAEERIRVWR